VTLFYLRLSGSKAKRIEHDAEGNSYVDVNLGALRPCHISFGGAEFAPAQSTSGGLSWCTSLDAAKNADSIARYMGESQVACCTVAPINVTQKSWLPDVGRVIRDVPQSEKERYVSYHPMRFYLKPSKERYSLISVEIVAYTLCTGNGSVRQYVYSHAGMEWLQRPYTDKATESPIVYKETDREEVPCSSPDTGETLRQFFISLMVEHRSEPEFVNMRASLTDCPLRSHRTLEEVVHHYELIVGRPPVGEEIDDYYVKNDQANWKIDWDSYGPEDMRRILQRILAWPPLTNSNIIDTMRSEFHSFTEDRFKKLLGFLRDGLPGARGALPENQLYRRLMIAITSKDPCVDLAREISLLLQLKKDVVAEKK